MRLPSVKAIAALMLMFAATVTPAAQAGHGALGGAGPPTVISAPDTPIPDTPAGSQLDWAIRVLNQEGEPLSEATLTSRFSPELLSLIPADQVGATLGVWATAGPFEFQGFTRPPTPAQATALLAGTGGASFVLPVAVESAGPHRISGLDLIPLAVPDGVDLHGITADGPQTGYSGGLYDIGGRQMYLSCRGRGSPTVVLESGLGDGAAPWFAVESAVAGFTRVCSYDRANTLAGASDPAPTPRAGLDAVADLHALLRTANIPGPYVISGHSIGGHIARLYAAQFPDEVAGMVLVDPSYEAGIQVDGTMDSGEPEQAEDEMAAGGGPKDLSDLEGMDRDLTNAQVRAAAPPCPMPLVVITAGHGFDDVELPPGISARAMTELWIQLQASIARLVPDGRQIVAEWSGHYIHQSEPDLVVDAIRDVVEAVRR
jgi:pimeloyl-ACP methyl ester carboxylesterase